MSTPSYKTKNCQQYGFWFLVSIVFLAFLQMNLQKVVYDFLGMDQFTVVFHPVLFAWLIAPVLLWLVAVRNQLRYQYASAQDVSIWLFSILLLIHASIIMALYGLIVGLGSFLSWGVWLPLYLLVRRYRWVKMPNMVVGAILFAGMLNAIPVLWEFVTDNQIFKSVSVMEVKRLYGLNQSISILGVQLATGALASIYMIDNVPSVGRVWAWVMFLCQAIALVVCTSRAPLFFFGFALIFMVLVRRQGSRQELWLCLLISIALIGALLLPQFTDLFGLSSHKDYLGSALTTYDEGNSVRLGLYQKAISVWFDDAQSFVLGYGAGSLSNIAKYMNREELGVESSLLKVFLECGLVGACLVLIPWILVVRKVPWLVGTSGIYRQSIPLLAILLVISLESVIHESLKTWVIQYYLWSVLGAIDWLWRSHSRGPAESEETQPNLVHPPFTSDLGSESL